MGHREVGENVADIILNAGIGEIVAMSGVDDIDAFRKVGLELDRVGAGLHRHVDQGPGHGYVAFGRAHAPV